MNAGTKARAVSSSSSSCTGMPVLTGETPVLTDEKGDRSGTTYIETRSRSEDNDPKPVHTRRNENRSTKDEASGNRRLEKINESGFCDHEVRKDVPVNTRVRTRICPNKVAIGDQKVRKYGSVSTRVRTRNSPNKGALFDFEIRKYASGSTLEHTHVTLSTKAHLMKSVKVKTDLC